MDSVAAQSIMDATMGEEISQTMGDAAGPGTQAPGPATPSRAERAIARREGLMRHMQAQGIATEPFALVSRAADADPAVSALLLAQFMFGMTRDETIAFRPGRDVLYQDKSLACAIVLGATGRTVALSASDFMARDALGAIAEAVWIRCGTTEATLGEALGAEDPAVAGEALVRALGAAGARDAQRWADAPAELSPVIMERSEAALFVAKACADACPAQRREARLVRLARFALGGYRGRDDATWGAGVAFEVAAGIIAPGLDLAADALPAAAKAAVGQAQWAELSRSSLLAATLAALEPADRNALSRTPMKQLLDGDAVSLAGQRGVAAKVARKTGAPVEKVALNPTNAQRFAALVHDRVEAAAVMLAACALPAIPLEHLMWLRPHSDARIEDRRAQASVIVAGRVHRFEFDVWDASGASAALEALAAWVEQRDAGQQGGALLRKRWVAEGPLRDDAPLGAIVTHPQANLRQPQLRKMIRSALPALHVSARLLTRGLPDGIACWRQRQAAAATAYFARLVQLHRPAAEAVLAARALGLAHAEALALRAGDDVSWAGDASLEVVIARTPGGRALASRHHAEPSAEVQGAWEAVESSLRARDGMDEPIYARYPGDRVGVVHLDHFTRTAEQAVAEVLALTLHKPKGAVWTEHVPLAEGARLLHPRSVHAYREG